MIQFIIELIVLLIGFYYVTIFIHFLGFNIFKGKKVTFGTALIPFYVWLTKNINEGNTPEEEIPVQEPPKTTKRTTTTKTKAKTTKK